MTCNFLYYFYTFVTPLQLIGSIGITLIFHVAAEKNPAVLSYMILAVNVITISRNRH